MKPNACAVALSLALLCGSVPSAPAATQHDPADPGVPPAVPAAEVDDVNAGRPAPADGPAGMVIVTDAALVPAFRRLADAHGRLGLTTRVRTLQAIRDAYPAGRDDAERIRLFLKDARADWGIEFALMGGDDPLIPMRRAFLDQLPPIFEQGTILLPTDQYYACLDGDWNADGDDRWGELPNPITGDPGDDADVVPELCVGRAPVNTRPLAQDFVDKTIRALDRAVDTDVLDVLLAAGGAPDQQPFPSFFFAPQAEDVRAVIGSSTSANVIRLYRDAANWPGSEPLTSASLLAQLAAGPELSILFGFGGPGTFSLDSGQPGSELIAASAFLALDNRKSIGHSVALSAYTTAPGILSIGAALVDNRQGGSASVLGPSDVEFVSIANAYIDRYLEKGFGEHAATVGEAMRAGLRDPVVPPTTAIVRLTTFGNILLGDPALPFPTGSPPPLPASLTTPSPAALDVATGLQITHDVIRAPRSAPAASVAPAAIGEGASSSVRLDRSSSLLHVEFETPRAVDGRALELSVLDLAGRRLRQLDGGLARAGRRSMTWDLRDEAGRRVPAGLYFVRVDAGLEHQVVRAVVW